METLPMDTPFHSRSVESEASSREMVASAQGAISAVKKLGTRDEIVAENERVHARPQETVQRFLRTANDRLVVIE